MSYILIGLAFLLTLFCCLFLWIFYENYKSKTLHSYRKINQSNFYAKKSERDVPLFLYEDGK